MKSTMKRCLAFVMVLAMLLSVCALPVFAQPAIAEPCEHAADVEPKPVVIINDGHTHSRYDKYECGECGAKWIENVVLDEAHDYESVVTDEPTYPQYEIDPETGDIVTETVLEEVEGLDAPVPVTKPVLATDEGGNVVEDGKGVSTPICKICGYEDTQNAIELPALTHSKFEGMTNPDGCCVYTVVTPPTCDEPGEYTYVCQENGAHPLEESGEIPALGHEYSLGDYIAATETEGAKVKIDCVNDCGGYTIDIVAEAPAHENCAGTIEDMTRAGNCVDYAITLYRCDTCDLSYAMGYAEATGHNLAEHEVTAQSCTADREIVKYCTNCVNEGDLADYSDVEDMLLLDILCNRKDANGMYGLYEKEVDATALKTGHYYMDGETRVDIDPAVCNEDAEGNGAVCASCGEDFGHVLVQKETPATCGKEGAEWEECSDPACDYEKVHNVIPAKNHNYVKDEESFAATLVKDGWYVEVCENCGNKKEGVVLEAAYDIAFKTTVASTRGPEATIVNKGWIAYTISLDAVNVDVYSLSLTVNFEKGALTYRGFNLGEAGANAFGVYVKDNRGTTTATDIAVANQSGKVIINAFSANYEDGEIKPVTLDGAQEFVTLLFEVNNNAFAEVDTVLDAEDGNSRTYSIQITAHSAMNVDGESEYKLTVDNESVTNVKVRKLGDLNNDGVINVKDQLAINTLIAFGMDENAAPYEAQADINQDGYVDFEDLYIVNQYLNTSIKYSNFIAY